MGRERRQVGAGAVYHLMARGNDRQPIFRTDDDRVAFEELLAVTCRRYAWTCFAYCLMGNHVHLALRTEEPSVSRGMAFLIGRYARVFNRRHGRRGHLFGERFRSVVIESDAQLLAVVRYVARNPVRGGLTEQPEFWQWSSYPAMLGLSEAPGFLAAGEVLAMLDGDPRLARRMLRALVAEEDEPVGHQEDEEHSTELLDRDPPRPL